jgi:hypothetical protein
MTLIISIFASVFTLTSMAIHPNLSTWPWTLTSMCVAVVSLVIFDYARERAKDEDA